MEVEEIRLGNGDISGCVNSSDSDGLENHVGSSRIRENDDNLGDCILEDLDSYLEDIDDRLIISRMVSESVIKGMVKAVEQVASERIAAKSSELTDNRCRLGESQGAEGELGSLRSFSDGIESLGSLRSLARAQIKKLKKEIDILRGSNPIRRSCSSSEMLGLGGILQEKPSGNLVGVGATIETLETTLDNMISQVDHMVCLAKSYVCEKQEEQEFHRELEAMVIQSSLSSLREEFEKKLWEQNACFCGSRQTDWLQRINEISDLKKVLEAISKSLSPDNAPLVSHGSHDMSHFHRKSSSKHMSLSTSVLEGIGIGEGHSNGMKENWDAAQLKHLSRDELVNHFNSMMTMMKRNRESKVQEMTEEFFALKRDFLKEKGSNSSPLRKDKDLDALRKKIPQVISKLDDILVENEKLVALSNNNETLGSLQERLDSLLSENRQLRDSLSDKKKEVKFLTSKVSNTTEVHTQKLIVSLQSLVEDEEIKASVCEEVFKCVLREFIPGVMCKCAELEVQHSFMQEICEVLYREAAQKEARSKYEIEDAEIESFLKQGLIEVILKEAIKYMQSQIDDINSAYRIENQLRASLELKVLEKEAELVSAYVEKERYKEEFQILAASLEERDNLAHERLVALTEDREKFEDLASCLGTMLSDKSRELDSTQSKLAEALERIEVDKVELIKLNQKLELATKELSDTTQHMNMLTAVNQEQSNNILALEAKETEQRKLIQAMVVLSLGLSRALSDFEYRVSEDIEKNNTRLKESTSQLSCLIPNSNVLKKTNLLYKQKFERKCADLQMAEAEVDLLGDEVDTLLGLLEKIYIALDHYSPILQHYPGIIAILKLVKKELKGVSSKVT